MLFTLILATMLVVGLSYVRYARQLAELQRKITTLAEENSALRTATAVLPPAPKTVTTPEKQPIPVHKEEVAAKPQLPAVMAAPAPAPYCAAAVIIATVKLREAVREGRPFTAQLASLSALLSHDESTAPALASLEPIAAKGVPTLAMLQESFTGAKDQIARIAAALPENPSFADRLKQSFSKIVTIRRINPPPGAPKESTVIATEAETALAQGNVTATAQLLAGLENEEARQAVSSWLEQASLFLTAETSIRTLYNTVTSPSYIGGPAPKGTPQ
jgi:hypothetical protein